MSNSYRNGAFALGLVVGTGLALNLLLWLDYLSKQQTENDPNTYNEGGYSQIGSGWDWLLRTFVSPSDTLAQWIMAAFTIIATVVLVFTLRSANKTNIAAVDAAYAAREANEIMRAEQRAWLNIDLVPFRDIVLRKDGSFYTQITVKVTNVGHSIARDAVIAIKPYFIQTNDLSPMIETEEWMNERLVKSFDDGFRRNVFPSDSIEFQPDLHVALGGAPGERYIIRVLAAALYRTDQVDGPRRTFVHFDITNSEPDGISRVIIVSDGVVDRGRIRVSKNGNGRIT